jgi:hypothetical protein
MSDEYRDATEVDRADPGVEDQARRNFLSRAGRFAAVTPPAITLLLGTSLGSQAIAASNGGRPRSGWYKKPRHRIDPPGHKKKFKRVAKVKRVVRSTKGKKLLRTPRRAALR